MEDEVTEESAEQREAKQYPYDCEYDAKYLNKLEKGQTGKPEGVKSSWLMIPIMMRIIKSYPRLKDAS